MTTRSVTVVDRNVGARIRMRRMMLGISQEKLGDVLGITFQQVQKYEKGANRVSAGRLLELSQHLQCPISFFFEGLVLPDGQQDGLATGGTAPHAFTQIMTTSEGIELVGAFEKIGDRKVRRAIASMVAQFVESRA